MPAATATTTTSPNTKPTQLPSNSNTNTNSNEKNEQANKSNPTTTNGLSNRIDLLDSNHGRILCIADLRGAISQINDLAKQFNAVAVIHSGDFGFYEPSSLDRISDRTLRHLIQYSSLINPQFRSQLLAPSMNAHSIRQMLLSPPKPSESSSTSTTPNLNSSSNFALSEFPDLLTGKLKLEVPVYTVWGACEDVAILEKIRAAGPSVLKTPTQPSKTTSESNNNNKVTTISAYSIPNLTVIDEATTRCLVIGGVRLRLFGLGGAVVPHKLFDNGEGGATIAGGQGTMWTSVLQIGELVDTAQRVYDPTETRLLISHASPGREGLLAQLALVLKTDLTISAGLHFRYGVSYNEFSVQHDQEAFRSKLTHAKSTFNEIWDTVKNQVDCVVDEHQRQLLSNALAVANRVPAPPPPGSGAAAEEPAWKNSWNWNLPDAAYGSLVLDIKEGRIGAEMRSQGFNFAYRSQAQPKPPTTPTQVNSRAPVVNTSHSSANPTDNQSATRPSTSVHTSQNHNSKPTGTTPTNSKNPFSPLQQSDSPVTPPAGGPSNNHPNRFNQQQGSRHGSQSNSRHSNQYSNQPHRYSKSRDENRDDDPRTRPSSQSNSGAFPTDSGSKPASQTRSKSGQDDQSKNSPSAANQQESSNNSASPAPSRKASFANNKKKKGSVSQPIGGKNESEPTSHQGKTEGEAETGGAPTKNGTNNNFVPNNKEVKGKTNKQVEEGTIMTTNAEVNEKPTSTKSNNESSNVVNGDNGNNHHNNSYNNSGRGRFPTSRGRGGPGYYNNNMRNHRGGGGGGRGRGGDRGAFNHAPVGPGLVGAALADAGIGNNNKSLNNNNATTVGVSTGTTGVTQGK